MITFNKLWRLMDDKKITKYALREHYDIDSRTIRRLMSNQNVTTDTLNKLCNILDCDISDILDYTKD